MTTEKYNGYISIPEGTFGKVSVKHVVRPAGSELDTANMRCQLFGQPNTKLRYEDETIWHVLEEEDRGVWMTDDPCEQVQMRDCLKEAHGDVLVGGLGLGIAVKILDENLNVDSITVVEKSKDVIDLVWEANCKSIWKENSNGLASGEIIHADLFEKLKEWNGTKVFDFAFYDIWQGDNEGVFFNTVIPLRKLSEEVIPNDNIVCWNEDVMRGQLLMGLNTKVRIIYNEEMAKAFKSTREELLDTFCGSDDKYIKWSRKFFEWIRDEEPTEEIANEFLGLYVKVYGKLEWEEIWEDEIYEAAV